MPVEPTVFIINSSEELIVTLRHIVESVDLKVRTYSTADEYLNDFDPCIPGCILVDVCLRGMSGLKLQEHLKPHRIHPPFIFVTKYADIQTAVKAIKHGAIDYILNPFSEQNILDSVYMALEKDTLLRKIEKSKTDVEKKLNRLTPRENEVMHLVVAGFSNLGISNKLHICQSTVERHRGRVMAKAEARTLSDLLRIVCTYKASSNQEYNINKANRKSM